MRSSGKISIRLPVWGISVLCLTTRTPVPYVFAVDSICKGVPLSSQLKALKTNREVIDYVARTPDAIGIIGVNWLSDRNDSTGLSFSKEVRLMSVSAADKAMPDNSYNPIRRICITVIIRWHAASMPC